jgi:hypothetical protein
MRDRLQPPTAALPSFWTCSSTLFPPRLPSMPEPFRVVLHTADPGPMIAEIARRFPQVEATPCAEFHALPEVMAASRPDALYTVRFEPGPFPRDAIFAENGPRWVAMVASGSTISATGTRTA